MNKLYEKLTLWLLVVLPINYMVFNILLKRIHLIKYLKDFIIIGLILVAIVTAFTKGQFKVKKKDSVAFLSAVGIGMVVLIRIITSSSIPDSLYTTRLLIVPLLFYFLYNIKAVSEVQIVKIYRVLFYLCVILAIWGIFQAFLLGDSFLIKLNYKGNTGRLSSGFYISGFRGIQRVTSTFAAPNIYALFSNSMFLLLISVKDELNINRKKFISGILVILLSSILTFSRSGWLGLGIGVLYYVLKNHKISKSQIKYFLIGGIFLLILTGYIIIVNENIYIAFSKLILKTFNRTDASLIGHMDSFISTMKMIFSNPFGYKWLGYSGPRTRLGIINYNVESSYLLMGLELGIIGVIFYTTFFIGILYSKPKNKYTTGIQSAIFTTIPPLFLLPLLEEFEVITFFFIMISLTNNLGNIKNKYRNL